MVKAVFLAGGVLLAGTGQGLTGENRSWDRLPWS